MSLSHLVTTSFRTAFTTLSLLDNKNEVLVLTGCQLDTGVVGRLDILAVDRQGGYVVIELKASEADDKVCGQILRYMGWVKRELAGGSSVRGIIVASDFDERVKYAVEAMPNVSLERYEVHFEFLDA